MPNAYGSGIVSISHPVIAVTIILSVVMRPDSVIPVGVIVGTIMAPTAHCVTSGEPSRYSSNRTSVTGATRL